MKTIVKRALIIVTGAVFAVTLTAPAAVASPDEGCVTRVGARCGPGPGEN